MFFCRCGIQRKRFFSVVGYNGRVFFRCGIQRRRFSYVVGYNRRGFFPLWDTIENNLRMANKFCSQLLPDRCGGRPESSLSLRSHGRGTPPPPGPGEGDVTPPYSWSIADTTATSLLRGTGGFNHLRESLNPSLHTGCPRRGRSFRRRLRRWCWWHGYWSVERTSYVYVVASEYVAARLRRHWGRIDYAPGVWLR
jgi:hypothetical protein